MNSLSKLSEEELRRKYFNNPIQLLEESIWSINFDTIQISIDIAKVLKIDKELFKNKYLINSLDKIFESLNIDELVSTLDTMSLFQFKRIPDFKEVDQSKESLKILFCLIENGMNAEDVAIYIYEKTKSTNLDDFLIVAKCLIKNRLYTLTNIEKDQKLQYLLDVALDKNDFEMIKDILVNVLYKKSISKEETLLKAIKMFQIKVVRLLIKERVNIHYQDEIVISELVSVKVKSSSQEKKIIEIFNILTENGANVQEAMLNYPQKWNKIESPIIKEFIENYLIDHNISNTKNNLEGTNKISLKDIEQLPYYKEALNSNLFYFNTEEYLRYLNSVNDTDLDDIVIKLLKAVIDNAGDITICSLFFDFAISLKGWHIVDLEDLEEGVEDTGFEQMLDWVSERFDGFNELQNVDTTKLTIDEHFYYSIEFIQNNESEKNKNLLAFGLYHFIRNCMQNHSEVITNEILDFRAFLMFKQQLKSGDLIYLDNDPIINIVKNNSGKYEVYEASSSIEACVALDKGIISDDEYADLYCLDDEYDSPVIFYNERVFQDEYDNYKVFDYGNDYNEIKYLALLKGGVWDTYKLSTSIESVNFVRFVDLVLKEIKKLRGENINLIETKIIKLLKKEFEEEW